MGARLGRLCVSNELTANSASLIDNRSSTFLRLTFHLFFPFCEVFGFSMGCEPAGKSSNIIIIILSQKSMASSML